MAYDPSLLHPAFRSLIEQAIAWAAARGVTLVPVQGTRTEEEQRALYNQGRSAGGSIVTNAGPGQSLHNYGVAVDLVPAELVNTPDWSPDSPLWNVVGQAADAVGLEWGGNWDSFVDRPHVQMAGTGGWRNLSTLPRDENGFVMLDAAPTARGSQHGAATRAPATPTSTPATPSPPSGEGSAPQAPQPAPETPVQAVVRSIGQQMAQQQPAAATPAAPEPSSPLMAASDLENSRSKLGQMRGFLLPEPETVATAPQGVNLAREGSDGPLGGLKKPDFGAQSAFSTMFRGAKPAPLGGGIRVRGS